MACAKLLGPACLALWLSACLVVPGEADVSSLFKCMGCSDESLWPSDQEETKGLGVGRSKYQHFCLRSRDLIIAATTGQTNRAAGRVFNLMADYYERNKRVYDNAMAKADKAFKADGAGDVRDYELYASKHCMSPMNKIYHETIGKLVKERLQEAVYSVCNKQNYKLIERLAELYKQLISSEMLFKISLEQLGCKTAARFKSSIRGCSWLKYMSERELPFIAKPGVKPVNDGKAELRALEFMRKTTF